ncbi:hypothetical protein B0H14DRAFT_1339151 [Mycena olivaceomarginata]|nr:hypothetical protein B0H14DRAFT_1339151 [Mycena olivaceomarginata]
MYDGGRQQGRAAAAAGGECLDLREAESATQTHPGPETLTTPRLTHARTHTVRRTGSSSNSNRHGPRTRPAHRRNALQHLHHAPNAFRPPLFPADDVDVERSRLKDESRRSSWPGAGAVAEAVDADLARLPFTGPQKESMRLALGVPSSASALLSMPMSVSRGWLWVRRGRRPASSDADADANDTPPAHSPPADGCSSPAYSRCRWC